MEQVVEEEVTSEPHNVDWDITKTDGPKEDETEEESEVETDYRPTTTEEATTETENEEENEGGAETDGGKKGGKKKGKKGGKKKGKKGKKKKKKKKKKKGKVGEGPPLAPPPVPPPAPPPYKLLPPFSLAFHLFNEDPIYVEQIELPRRIPTRRSWLRPSRATAAESGVEAAPSTSVHGKSSVRESKQAKGGVGWIERKVVRESRQTRESKSRTKHDGKKKKKKDKKKKGKKKKGKKKKKKPKKPVKSEVPFPSPVLPPTPAPSPYSPEELLWQLEDEEWFGRGLEVTRTTSADRLISWLQTGYLTVDIHRWKGYGAREKIARAKICIPSEMSEMALQATNKLSKLPLMVESGGEAVIRDENRTQIGFMSVSFSLTCFGESWTVPRLLSSGGLKTVLGSCQAERAGGGSSLESKRQSLEEMYDIVNLAHFIATQTDYGQRVLPPLTFEDIVTATC